MIRLCILFLPIFVLSNQAVSIEISLDSLLTPEEKVWLSEHKNTIRFSSDPSWPPSIYVEEGQLKGFITDYLKQLEQQLDIQLQWVHYQTWPEVLEALRNNEIDFIAGIHETAERQRHFLFSDSFEEIELGILIHKDAVGRFSNKETQNIELISVKEYASNEYLNKVFPGASIVYADDYSEAILKASYGLADGVVIDFITADFLLEKYGISNLVYGKRLGFRWEIMFAVGND